MLGLGDVLQWALQGGLVVRNLLEDLFCGRLCLIELFLLEEDMVVAAVSLKNRQEKALPYFLSLYGFFKIMQ